MFGLELIKELTEHQRDRLSTVLRMYQVHGGMQIHIRRIIGDEIWIEVKSKHVLNLAQLNDRVEAAFKDDLPTHYRLVVRPN